jgi:hypothetical protein
MKAYLLVVIGSLVACSASAQSGTSWVVNLRADPITDEINGSATLPSADGGRLVFACNGVAETTLSVQYLPRRYLGSRPNLVIFRFDSDPALPSVSWEYTSKGAYTLSEPFIEFFSSQVGDGERSIHVRALNYENQPVDAVFISRGGREAVNQVREACRKPPV